MPVTLTPKTRLWCPHCECDDFRDAAEKNPRCPLCRRRMASFLRKTCVVCSSDFDWRTDQDPRDTCDECINFATDPRAVALFKLVGCMSKRLERVEENVERLIAGVEQLATKIEENTK